MLDIFKKWYKRYLSEEESVLVLVLLAIAVALFMTIGDILKPVVAAIVLAYLAQGGQEAGSPRPDQGRRSLTR